MASTNFKLFDENKTNMMSDTEYNINTQRLNGVQAGIASSQLQNKTLHQTSLVAYSLAQIMMQNGYDANDSAAVSAFVGNMSNSLLQKVLDKATSAEAQAGTITNKWISPATMKAAALLLSGGTMSGPINMGNNKITNLADPTDLLDSANKKYVDDSTALIYFDWVTFEHSVSDFIASTSRTYDYNIKDENGNENYEVGHDFIQIQASETFYSDNNAALQVGTLDDPNYTHFIYDSHPSNGDTSKNGKCVVYGTIRDVYSFIHVSRAGLTICRMKITSGRSTGGSLCNATVTGKYRYIDFKV